MQCSIIKTQVKLRFYVLFICVFFLYSFGFFFKWQNDTLLQYKILQQSDLIGWGDLGGVATKWAGTQGNFFNEMFVFLIIQDDFKKLIKLVENWQNMTQTFQREKIDGEKKKVKIKDVWSKGKQQKILFFLYHSIFF